MPPEHFDFALADRNARARQFARGVLHMMRGRGRLEDSIASAKAAGEKGAVVQYIRAQVAGHATISGGAEALGEPSLADAFLAALASNGAYDAMLADMMPGSMHTQFGMVIVNPTAATRIEGRATRASLAVLQRGVLEQRETAALIVLSREVLTHGKGVEVLERALRVAAASAVDAVFLAAVASAATAVSVAGMTPHEIHEDLRAGLAALSTDTGSRVHIALAPALAKRLSAVSDANGQRAFPQMTLSGGQLCGLPVAVSDAAGADVLLVDAAGYVGAAEPVEVDVSNSASIKLDDNPSMASHDGASPPAPAEVQLLSMFQSNSSAVRVRRRFAFQAMRSAAVKLTNAASSWGLVGSPPA